MYQNDLLMKIETELNRLDESKNRLLELKKIVEEDPSKLLEDPQEGKIGVTISSVHSCESNPIKGE